MHSIIDSTSDYLYRLRYLGTDRKHDLRDIHTLNIIWDIYKQADWYGVSEEDKKTVRVVMDKIIMSNSELRLPSASTEKYYVNVNTPQNIWTWQRIYDNLQFYLIHEPYIYDEVGFELLFENGDNITYENFLQ